MEANSCFLNIRKGHALIFSIHPGSKYDFPVRHGVSKAFITSTLSMKSLVALILWALILPLSAMAQETIETDRPTEAQTPKVVAKGELQIELGLKKVQQNRDSWSVQHPNALFRYGLANWLELRLESNLETQKFGPSGASGLKPIEAGFKLKGYQTADTTFVLSLYSLIGFPRLASADHRNNRYFYRFRFLLENKITDKVSLNYNIGRDWDDQQMDHKWIYAVAPQLALSERWELFGELYGRFEQGYEPEHYVDGGAAYSVNNNLKADLNLGKGLTKASSDYFITAGLSFKIGGR